MITSNTHTHEAAAGGAAPTRITNDRGDGEPTPATPSTGTSHAATASTSTAARLHRLITELWPAIPGRRLVVDVSASRHFAENNCQGEFFRAEVENHRLRAYAERPDASNVLCELLGRDPVLDAVVTVSADEGGTPRSWREFLEIGLHEAAHAIRDGLAREGLYPKVAELTRLSKYLETRKVDLFAGSSPKARAEIEQISELPGASFAADQALGDLDPFIFPSPAEDRAYSGGPLLGDWAVRSDQHDGEHDLMFHLILFALERKAHDAGLFDLKLDVAPSTYVSHDVEFMRTLEA